MVDDVNGRNRFLQLWLVLGVVAGFVGIVFFSVIYLNNELLCDLNCRARNEVSLMLVLFSFVGMFVGSLTYYFISDKYEKRIVKIHRDVGLTLKFLGKEEREIVGSIVDGSGEASQSRIVQDTGFSRVKVSRILKRLEERGVVVRSQKGMTNLVSLEKGIGKLFFE